MVTVTAKAKEMAALSIRKASGREPSKREIIVLATMVSARRPIMADEFAPSMRCFRDLEKMNLIEWHADGWRLSK